MDAMVSARVPVEIKKQGDRKLKEIGSSATELINTAYEYVIANGELPRKSAASATANDAVKTLSGPKAEALRERLNKRRVLDMPGYDGSNFRELLDEARGDYYARFA